MKFIVNFLKGNLRDNEELPSEASLSDFISNGTQTEISPDVHDTPLVHEDNEKESFVLNGYKYTVRKSTRYKSVYIINYVQEHYEKFLKIYGQSAVIRQNFLSHH